MEIKIDDKIQEKCINTINKYMEENGNFPSKLILGVEEYRDLWIDTYYNWTRAVNQPHNLNVFAGCTIEIKYTETISCE